MIPESETDRYLMRAFGAAFPGLTETSELERAAQLRERVLADLKRPKPLTIFDLIDNELIESEDKAVPLDS